MERNKAIKAAARFMALSDCARKNNDAGARFCLMRILVSLLTDDYQDFAKSLEQVDKLVPVPEGESLSSLLKHEALTRAYAKTRRQV